MLSSVLDFPDNSRHPGTFYIVVFVPVLKSDPGDLPYFITGESRENSADCLFICHGAHVQCHPFLRTEHHIMDFTNNIRIISEMPGCIVCCIIHQNTAHVKHDVPVLFNGFHDQSVQDRAETFRKCFVALWCKMDTVICELYMPLSGICIIDFKFFRQFTVLLSKFYGFIYLFLTLHPFSRLHRRRYDQQQLCAYIFYVSQERFHTFCCRFSIGPF